MNQRSQPDLKPRTLGPVIFYQKEQWRIDHWLGAIISLLEGEYVIVVEFPPLRGLSFSAYKGVDLIQLHFCNLLLSDTCL